MKFFIKPEKNIALEDSGGASPTVVAAVCRCSCLGQWLTHNKGTCNSRVDLGVIRAMIMTKHEKIEL